MIDEVWSVLSTSYFFCPSHILGQTLKVYMTNKIYSICIKITLFNSYAIKVSIGSDGKKETPHVAPGDGRISVPIW